jgi:hypothetical protein
MLTATHEIGLGTPDYESGGQEFESLRARHRFQQFFEYLVLGGAPASVVGARRGRKARS